MGRRRKENKDLPENVQLKHGGFYFIDTTGQYGKKNKWHFLGRIKYEAIILYYTRFAEVSERILTMGDLFDKYMLKVAPTKSPQSYKNNLLEIRNLRVFFSNMAPESVTPVDVYKYIEIRSETSGRGALLEKALLSHVFTKAIEWGVVKINPCRDVKVKRKKKKKDRTVSHHDFAAQRIASSEPIKWMMKMAYITSLRESDLLSIELEAINAEGIYKVINKTETRTGKAIFFKWTPKLKYCVDRLRALRRGVKTKYLICNQQGKKYTTSGFQSIWQRDIRRALAKGKLRKRFRFNDIRHKRATDAEKKYGIEFSRQLLGHETQKMTSHYINGAQVVTPKT